VSSGAIMATQLHVIYSSRIMGAGLIAGGECLQFITNKKMFVLNGWEIKQWSVSKHK
jgi:hypothetical protein